MKHLGPIILLLLFFAPAGWAGDSLRAVVDSAFARGQYEQVELLALRHVNDLITRPVETRVAVNLTTGYALIMLGREADAEGYFRRALDADPARAARSRAHQSQVPPRIRYGESGLSPAAENAAGFACTSIRRAAHGFGSSAISSFRAADNFWNSGACGARSGPPRN